PPARPGDLESRPTIFFCFSELFAGNYPRPPVDLGKSEQMYPPQGPRHASVDLGGVERLYPLPVPARPRFDCWGRTYPRSLATRDYHPARPDTPGYGRATSPDLQPPPTTAHLTSRIRPNA